MNPKTAVLISKTVLVGWCLFWCGFAVLSGMSDKSSPVSALPYVLGFCAVVVAITVVGFRGDRLAVISLGCAAVLVAVGYPVMAWGRFGWNTILFMELTMAMPPALAAAMILHGRR